MPRSSRSMFNSWMICACTVTSSADVGSSAISTSGSSTVAIAIITRWHIPPDSSPGNDRATRRGSGRRMRVSTSIEISCASFRVTAR